MKIGKKPAPLSAQSGQTPSSDIAAPGTFRTGRTPDAMRRKTVLRRNSSDLLLLGLGAGVCLPAAAVAAPQGFSSVSGDVSMTTSADGKTTWIKTGAENAISESTHFDINVDESVIIQQPNAGSMLLHRVTGPDPSSLLGHLESNGRFMLVNPNGILFGKNATIDVSGLVATTSDIRDEDFLAGRFDFTIGSDNPDAFVINKGTINIRDLPSMEQSGFAALVAPHVRNDGIITARLGKVVLASAEAYTLDFVGDGLISFRTGVTETPTENGKPVKALVENYGTITADGGHVILAASNAGAAVQQVINVEGLVRANTIEKRNGRVTFLASGPGEVRVNGEIRAEGDDAGETGGAVHIVGDRVLLDSKTRISTDGHAGGGEILVGGAYQGGVIRIAAAESLPSAACETCLAPPPGTDSDASPLTEPAPEPEPEDSQIAFAGPQSAPPVKPVQLAGPQETPVAKPVALLDDPAQPENPANGGLTARRTYVAAGASLTSDATEKGDGGTIIAWGDEAAWVKGSLSAQGAGSNADGGMIETSSGDYLDVNGASINTAGTDGNQGLWLLDPTDINIVSSGSDTSDLADVDDYSDADLSGSSTSLDVATINNATADILLQATNNINFNAAITNNNGISLTAQADADSSGTGGIFINAAVSMTGDLFLSGEGITIDATIDAANVDIDSGTGSTDINYAITTSGDTSIISEGLNVNATIDAVNVDIDSGFTLADINSAITTSGDTVIVSDDITIDATIDAANVDITATGGTATINGDITTTGGDTTVLADSITVNGTINAGSVDFYSTSGSTDVNGDITTTGSVQIAGIDLNLDSAINGGGAGELILLNARSGSVNAGANTTIDANGGEILLSANTSFNITSMASNSITNASETAFGFGGAALAGVGTSALSATFTVTGAELDVLDESSITNIRFSTSAGTSLEVGDIETSTNLEFTSGETMSLTGTANSSTGDVRMTASGDIQDDAGGAEIIQANNGLATLISGGNISGGTTGVFEVNASSVTAIATGNMTLSSTGATEVTGLSSSGGTIDFTSGNSGDITITGAVSALSDLTIASDGNLDFSGQTLTSGGTITLDATGDIIGGTATTDAASGGVGTAVLDVTAGGDISGTFEATDTNSEIHLTSSAGAVESVTVNTTRLQTNADGNIDIQAIDNNGNPLALNRATSTSGTIYIESENELQVGDDGGGNSVAADGDIELVSGGALTIGASASVVSTSGDVILDATGDLDMADRSVKGNNITLEGNNITNGAGINTTGLLDIYADGLVSLAPQAAEDILVTAGGDVTLSGSPLNSGSGYLDVFADGNVVLASDVDKDDVAVTSDGGSITSMNILARDGDLILSASTGISAGGYSLEATTGEAVLEVFDSGDVTFGTLTTTVGDATLAASDGYITGDLDVAGDVWIENLDSLGATLTGQIQSMTGQDAIDTPVIAVEYGLNPPDFTFNGLAITATFNEPVEEEVASAEEIEIPQAIETPDPVIEDPEPPVYSAPEDSSPGLVDDSGDPGTTIASPGTSVGGGDILTGGGETGGVTNIGDMNNAAMLTNSQLEDQGKKVGGNGQMSDFIAEILALIGEGRNGNGGVPSGPYNGESKVLIPGVLVYDPKGGKAELKKVDHSGYRRPSIARGSF